MSILKKLIIVILLLNLSVCVYSETRYERVSVHQLVIQSDKYLDKNVRVKGYIARGTGGIYIFATKDDAIMKNAAAGIPLKIINKLDLEGHASCLNRFVLIFGEYKYDDQSNTKGNKIFTQNIAAALDIPIVSGGEDTRCIILKE